MTTDKQSSQQPDSESSKDSQQNQTFASYAQKIAPIMQKFEKKEHFLDSARTLDSSENKQPTADSAQSASVAGGEPLTNTSPSEMLKKTQKMYAPILIAMIAGALFGFMVDPKVTDWLNPIGEIFIRLLKMIIIPLVFASLIIGVLSLGDLKKIGRIGGKTLIYFTITTMLALVVGLFLANIIRPGEYVSEKAKTQYQQEYQKDVQTKIEKKSEVNLKNLILETIPTNPIKAMADGNMLAIIFFAILFGIMLTTVAKEKRDTLHKALDAVNDAMVAMVMGIMKLAPIGVFCLMAATSAKIGLSVFAALLMYVIVVLIGFALHIVIVYGPLLWCFGRMSLWDFLKKVWTVELVAFSTSSSSATLPLTLRCTEEDLKVPKDVSSFIVSLGCTINMNGTALYLGVATLFVAQVYNIPLTWEQQAMVLLVATASAIGTPGIPGGSIVFLSLILEMVNIPAVGLALVIGVDRLLDMFRTTMNVMGDMTAAVCVNATEKQKI